MPSYAEYIGSKAIWSEPPGAHARPDDPPLLVPLVLLVDVPPTVVPLLDELVLVELLPEWLLVEALPLVVVLTEVVVDVVPTQLHGPNVAPSAKHTSVPSQSVALTHATD